MELGGAERSLLGLLESIAPDKCQVDLFLCRHSGELMQYIPYYVNLLPESTSAACIAVPIREALRRKAFGVVAGRCYAKVKTKVYDRTHHLKNSIASIENSNRYTYRFVPKVNPDITYDAVISFLEPHYIAAYNTVAKVKIAWMHTDYKAIELDKKAGLRVWSKFDYIVAISDKCFENFAEVFPELCSKLILLENPLPQKLIQAQVAGPIPDVMRSTSTCLLSIGRYCTAKNFDNVPDICARLVGMGLDVKWYIIGFGGSEALIRAKIAESGMEDRVILLGKKENPYPYFKACDLYVQPSRYEGKAVTVREAQMLGKPVVITRYATSASQLEDGVDGVIVPMDNEGCAKGIAALLRDPERMKALSDACASRDYSNRAEVEKLYRLME